MDDQSTIDIRKSAIEHDGPDVICLGELLIDFVPSPAFSPLGDARWLQMAPRASYHYSRISEHPSETPVEIGFEVTKTIGKVSARLLRSNQAQWLLVLGHGAGAGMRHAFMEAVARALADHGIATLRYQFPYMEQGSRRPDSRPVLLATVRAAVAAASEIAGGLPLLAGGKSMGGRMTSMAAAEAALPEVRGLVFFGFPLHPAGRPSTERGGHLSKVTVPMLFLQGTRDNLAELDLLRPICDGLGKRAELHTVDGADHSFHVLKSSGRTDRQILEELARIVASWASQLT